VLFRPDGVGRGDINIYTDTSYNDSFARRTHVTATHLLPHRGRHRFECECGILQQALLFLPLHSNIKKTKTLSFFIATILCFPENLQEGLKKHFFLETFFFWSQKWAEKNVSHTV
jgi:hypothetical protein